jgi:serine/threonine protein kinase
LLCFSQYYPAMRGGVGTLVAGRYLLAEAVGQGGMGRVWRGHDQLLDRVVAVKEVLLPPQAPEGRAELLARTMREARAAARLDHPGVITIHDVVEHDGSPWIVMQFVAGTSLRAQIERQGRLPWREVAGLGEQVAEALAAAHAAGIVHRDLKPDNILLSGRRVIVTDFGIARIMDSTTRLTSTGVLVGTPAYMAPEQLDGGDAGPAADLWALGATLYTAVEGTTPFAGATMTALIAAILTKTHPRLRHADVLLAETVAGLLAKEPARRPDAQAAARALAACRAGAAVRDPAASLRPTPTVAAGGSPSQPATPQEPWFPDTLTGGNRRPEGSGEASAAKLPPIAGRHPSFPGMHRPSAAHPEPPLVSQPPSRPAPARQRRWRLPAAILAAAAVLTAMAGAGAALLTSGSHSPGTASSSTRPPTGQIGTPTPASAQTGQHASASAHAGPVTTSLLATLADPGGDGGVSAVAFGPDSTLATGDGNGSTYLWNTTTDSLIATLADPRLGVYSVAFGPGGTVAVGEDNGSTYLWNTTIRSVIATFTDPNGESALSLAFGPDGSLAVGDGNGSTYLWNTTTGSLLATLPDPDGGSPRDVAFGPDGTLAVAVYNQVGPAAGGHFSGGTYLWNTATGSLLATLPAPQDTAPMSLAFGPHDTLAVTDVNGSTYLWNTTTRSVIATLTAPHGEYPTGVAFSPGGILAVADFACLEAACGEAPATTYLWNTATRSVIATIASPEGEPPDSVAFGPDDTLAVGDNNGSTYLWRIASGKS